MPHHSVAALHVFVLSFRTLRFLSILLHSFCLSNRARGQWAAGRALKRAGFMERLKIPKRKPRLALYRMMSYQNLEKEHDRNTAIETLKLIIKLGYKITRKDMGTLISWSI
ncbi:MAG: RyR domain-containing protein [Coprococcus sp.]